MLTVIAPLLSPEPESEPPPPQAANAPTIAMQSTATKSFFIFMFFPPKLPCKYESVPRRFYINNLLYATKKIDIFVTFGLSAD
jgi:hypothetical protein